jgi:hypothetical protein
MLKPEASTLRRMEDVATLISETAPLRLDAVEVEVEGAGAEAEKRKRKEKRKVEEGNPLPNPAHAQMHGQCSTKRLLCRVSSSLAIS